MFVEPMFPGTYVPRTYVPRFTANLLDVVIGIGIQSELFEKYFRFVQCGRARILACAYVTVRMCACACVRERVRVCVLGGVLAYVQVCVRECVRACAYICMYFRPH